MCTLTMRSRLSQYTNIPMHIDMWAHKRTRTRLHSTIHAIDVAALLFLLLDCWYFPFHLCWLSTFCSLSLSFSLPLCHSLVRFICEYDMCVQMCPFYLLFSLNILQFRLWKYCSGYEQWTNVLHAVCTDWHPVYAYRYGWYFFCIYSKSISEKRLWSHSFFSIVIADLGRVFATAVSALGKKLPSLTSKFRRFLSQCSRAVCSMHFMIIDQLTISMLFATFLCLFFLHF